jgi:hypothetical protein
MNQVGSSPVKYPFKLPRLVDYDGDLSKDWLFIYYVRDLGKEYLVRKRVAVTGATAALRKASAKRDIKTITDLLVAGAMVGKLKVLKKPAKLDAGTITIPDAILHAMAKKKTRIRGTIGK